MRTRLRGTDRGEAPVADLVAQAAGGDRAAWDALVARFSGLVWSVARSYRLDQASAADVSQATWLRLMENLGTIRRPESLGGWLATTASREALRLLRHNKRQVPSEFVEAMVEPVTDDAATRLELDEQASAVAAAFQELSPEHQQLLMLCVADPPLCYDEIADILGRPVGSIGPTRARALEQLRRRLSAIDPVAARC